MLEYKKLVEKAKSGFNTLDVSEKYTNAASKWLEIWLTDGMFEDYVPQIQYLIEKEKWDFVLDSFNQVIPFGTGGRRGLVGIGPNRINTWTIQASAQGHSQFLIKQFGEDAKQRSVVLTFDVRKYTQKGIYDDTLSNPNCYNVIDVEFPERGFLLFWQLPLDDKLRYFEIEGDIVNLKDISDRNEKEEKLYELLAFLGANPVEKINKAFKAKFETGILEYLGIA